MYHQKIFMISLIKRYYFLICIGMVGPFKNLSHTVITFSFSGGWCVLKITQCDLDLGYELPVQGHTFCPLIFV